MDTKVVWAALSLSFMISAQVAMAEEVGFGGDLLLGGVWERGKPSQLDAEEGDRAISNINTRSDSESDLNLYAGGELRYTFANENTTMFLSDLRHNDYALSTGVQHSIGELGTITAAFVYEAREVWKDTYRVGAPRSDTDEVSYGMAFDYSNVLGTGFFIASDIAMVEVDDDLIGKREKALQRDGFKGNIGAGYEVFLNEHITVVPSLTYTREDLDGKANSSNEYGMVLDVIWSFDDLIVEASAGFSTTNYFVSHPLYGRKRDATTFEVSALVSYYEPLGIPQTSIYSFAGYSKVNENIDFFDSDKIVAGAGIVYHF